MPSHVHQQASGVSGAGPAGKYDAHNNDEYSATRTRRDKVKQDMHTVYS